MNGPGLSGVHVKKWTISRSGTALGMVLGTYSCDAPAFANCMFAIGISGERHKNSA
jgi:hypothetical protein